MNQYNKKILSFAGAGLLGVAVLVYAEEVKPKVTPAEFDAKITRDAAPIQNPGQVVMSYADVVQRILPSVVSIGTYAKRPQGGLGGGGRGLPGMDEEDLQGIPPMFREFFKDYLDRRGNNNNNDDNEEQPQRRNQQPQRPRVEKPVQTGLGSGIILSADGYILTNNHVVENAEQLKVTIGGRSREYVAKVIGTDPSTDVALIKIEGENLPHATLGDSSKLRVGDVVLAVGSPMGLDQSVTQGIVSAMGRSTMGIIGSRKGQAGYENFIQTDAAINPGNSGGPLVDAMGRVIGINTAIETRSGMFSGIGLAIPIDMALAVAKDLLDDGKVDRGFLGIQMDSVEPGMAEFLGLKDEGGVTVSTVVAGSPAEKAGFQGGDVVVSADGEKVYDPSKLRLMVSARHAGEKVKFNVVRFNEQSKKPENLELIATLEKLDPEKLANNRSGRGVTPAVPDKANAFIPGVHVVNITDDTRSEYKIAEDVTGVLVTSVDETSPAATLLEEGDVITEVNRKVVRNIAEARANKSDAGSVTLVQVNRNGQIKFFPIKG